MRHGPLRQRTPVDSAASGSRGHASRTRSLALAALCVLALAAVPVRAAERLRVGDSGRFLVRQDGSPFFYLADTAWELFHRTTREEADLYLTDRAAKGFTVVQAVVLAELAGLDVPNSYGDLPLVDRDAAKPNDAYFRHVDYVVARAGRLGLHVAMLPTWGDKWNKKWGVGPEIFTPENAEVFGEYLGRRYKNAPIIWVLGGDRSPETEAHEAIVRAMARGLGRGDGGAHLMTYHPMGGDSSATFFHTDEWLDFNMFQSGHAAYDAPNYELTARAYALTPVKPVVDGEPRYEDHPVNWDARRGWFGDYDVRQAAYWSMLAGACGHTYGNHNIWQMWQPGRDPISSARTPWRKALDHPGASQVGFMRRLFESRPFLQLRPDPSVLASDPGKGAGRALAARAADGSYLFVYTPLGEPVAVSLSRIAGRKIDAFWFDPRTGKAAKIASFANGGTRSFTPSSRGRGNDWVLVLDDAARGFGQPGATR